VCVVQDRAIGSVEHPDYEESVARGQEARKRVSIEALCEWTSPPGRPDPVALLEEQERARVQWLLPLRHGRMALSSFAYFRGAARVMASDLASQPQSGLTAQICGDAHLSNFGVYGTPERRLVFDVNDFDETLPGPWEWDVKRLVASIVIAGRGNGFKKRDQKAAACAAAHAYRADMAEFAQLSPLEVYYSSISADDILGAASPKRREQLTKFFDKARTQSSVRVAERLIETVDGARRIRTQPPTLFALRDVPPHTTQFESLDNAESIMRAYRRSLQTDRRQLLESYRFVDVALKVVGVGSVGTRCFVAYFEGPSNEPLFLQIKQADASVLEPYLRKSRFRNHGQRVVEGQRLMQAASDVFLGWTPGVEGRDFYWRQLKDWKGGVDVPGLDPSRLTAYGALCARALAMAHAASGQPAQIASYLGDTSEFEDAMVGFAVAYAKQNDEDYAAFLDAIATGRIRAETE
jgi:uncharacterized protein (DUF2252 family)